MSKRLVGADGKLTSGSFGTEIVVGATLAEGVWYKIVAIDAASSVFPSGCEVGYLYRGNGSDVLLTDDIAAPFEGVDLCDIQNWGLDFSKSESDVTTMCDEQNVYRAGKTDVTGSIEGVMTIGVTDADNGFQNQFVSIVKQESGVYNLFPADDSEFYVQLYTDKTVDGGDIESFYFLPISVTGFSASAGGEDAQTFSSPFRVAPSDTGVVFYEYVIPLV